MFDFDDFDDLDDLDDDLSDAYIRWDDELEEGVSHGYFDPDELCDIVDAYLSLGNVDEAKSAIEYAVKMHPSHEDMIHDIMMMLSENELWDDLLTLTEKYKNLDQVWVDECRVTTLLHLGMEEDAFVCFGHAKKKYANDRGALITLYEAMSETLKDVDLYEAAVYVVNEILPQTNTDENTDLFWILLESYLAMDDRENVLKIGNYILKVNPMDAEAWSHLGEVYKDIEEKEKSIEAFEFAISLGKNEPEDVLNLIYSYKENGNFLKALEKTDEYLEIYPQDYVVNLLAANIAIEIEEWERAQKYTEKALEADPTSSFLYLYKSRCQIQLGEIKKAINTLMEGLKKSEDKTGEIKQQLSELSKKFPESR